MKENTEINKYKEERPWGNFEQFIKNEPCTVKIITVNEGEELSTQYHNHRAEFWRILEGDSSVFINDKEIKAKKGDEFFIKQGESHTARGPLVFMEIALGDFDESDIIRTKDKYNRT